MVFVPLSDENPRLAVRYPYVSWGLIALNLAVYVGAQTGRLAAQAVLGA